VPYRLRGGGEEASLSAAPVNLPWASFFSSFFFFFSFSAVQTLAPVDKDKRQPFLSDVTERRAA